MTSTTIPISVGRCAALETILQKPLITAQITSLHDMARIYCELHRISLRDADTVPSSDIVSYVHDFFEALVTDPDPNRPTFPRTIQPLTLTRLVQLEAAIGTPFYDSAFNFALISTQLICVEHGYGIPAAEMATIRDMPYPIYLADVWLPLYQQLCAALIPPAKIESAEDLPEKNPSGESSS